MDRFRILQFLGRAYDDLMDFPVAARKEAGRQLRRVQYGSLPADCKPMTTIGAGVAEIRVYDVSGAYRVIYVAKFEEAIYVLHCFKKKSQRTSRADIEIATSRYKTLVRDRARI